MNPRLVIALTLAAAFSLGALILVASSGGDGDPAKGKLEFEGARLPDGVETPNFSLRNQDGELVRMRALRGPVIVTFLYTHCDESCPAEAQQIKGALEELDDDVPALAIAVEPERDTPGSAREFLAKQGMTGRMDFVLGSRSQLERVWRGFYIQPQEKDVEHQARITIVAGGYQRVGYPLEQATPERIAHDVRVLQKD